MIKAGIIGFGKMGQIRAEAIRANGAAEIQAVYDIRPEVLPEDLSHAQSMEAILNDPEINTLFVCTPNYLNKELTIRGLKAGKNVFCEKPPAFTAAEIQEVIATEQQTNKKLMYGFNHRHHSSVKHIKTLVGSGEYGKVLWMRGRYGKSYDRSFYDSWRSQKEKAGGGIMLDQGIHLLDLFLYIADDFHDVHAFVSNLYWKLDIEDNVFAILRNNENNIVASIHSTMTQWRHLFSLEIFLEQGYLVLNGLKTSSGTYGDEILTIAKNRTTAPAATWEDEEKIMFQTDLSWRSEIDYFFKAIADDAPIHIGNSADAFKLMKVIDQIYREGNKNG